VGLGQAGEEADMAAHIWMDVDIAVNATKAAGARAAATDTGAHRIPFQECCTRLFH